MHNETDKTKNRLRKRASATVPDLRMTRELGSDLEGL